MDLPTWADGVFDSLEPTGRVGNDELKKRWFECRQRFERRWDILRPELWRVPVGAEPYAVFKRSWIYYHPSEQDVRYQILYCAVTLDIEAGMGLLPEKVAPAVKELAYLNVKIAQRASDLAELFRRRAEIKDGGHIDDRCSDIRDPDPYRLLEALCAATLNTPRLEFFGLLAKPSLEKLLRYARDVSHIEPEWPDLLNQLSICGERVVRPIGAGNVAVLSSGTNATKWSRWALRLLGMLDDQLPYPPSFLRSCLTHGQLATLLEITLDAPDGSYNEEQMGKLARAYEKRMKSNAPDDSQK